MATANCTASNNSARTAHCTIPAVAYIRCSSEQQVDASIPAQRASIEKWATEHGYKIVRWYVDEAISGWKEARDGFQQLITDLGRGDFEAVLCWDQNRFSRFPVLEANHYWYLLDRAGVHLATCNQGRIDWHSIAGWLTASIKQHSDAQHRFQLSADVKRGKRAVAERGVWQGRIPHGYVRGDDGKLLLGDALEVDTVRHIFAEYTAGRSLRGIAHKLNADGIAARDGRGWAAGSVRSKLTNPAYVGTFKWNEIELPNNHPAIIEPAAFTTVQRLLDERQTQTTPRKTAGEFLLTGILKCGKCGSAMHGFRSKHGHRYYWCQGHKRKGSTFCDLNSVKQPQVLEHIVTALESWLMNPKVVQRLRAELHRQVATKATKAKPERLRKQLTTLEGKLTKAKRRLLECDSDMLTEVQQGIRDIRREQERIEAALEVSQTPQDTLTAEQDERIDQAMSAFSTLRQTLAKADPLQLRELLRETIQRVDVWAERQTIGKQSTFRLVRGVVRMRADNLFGSSSG